jgi:hypothetical protein
MLVFSLVIFSIGIDWGLPGIETWCPDSLAPYHPLLGLSKLFSFGYFNKYPLVHQVILAVVNIPVLAAAAIKSVSADGLDVFRFFSLIRSENYATALILIDRSVSVLMGVGVVYLVYRCCLELFDEGTALFAALFVSLNAALNYHAHVAKVDVPYVFWGMAGIYYLIRIMKYDRRLDYILCAAMICLSFGTKDQGYAIFVIPVIIYLLVWQKRFIYPAVSYRDFLLKKNPAFFFTAFAISAVLVENVFFNFGGLIKRFTHLTGIGTLASINYSMDFHGIVSLLYMTAQITAENAMGVPFFIMSISGAAVLGYRGRKDFRELSLQLIFLVAVISYYVFFIQIARQNAYRFTLPISVFLSVYGGYAFNVLHKKLYGSRALVFYFIVVLCGIASVYTTVSINYNLITDVRYRAEKWMSDNIQPGSRIEYYSYLHYLPRFPESARSYRIKEDIAAVETRKPDYIVLSSSYDYRFIGNPKLKLPKGFKVPEGILRLQKEYGKFYSDLFGYRLNYRIEAMFTHDPWIFKEFILYRLVPHRIIVFRSVKDGEEGTEETPPYDPSTLSEE